MEWLSKITNPLAERAKSPLYGAFFISWLIWNWKIVITILLPNQTGRGDKGLVQFISENYVNICDGLVCPIIVAAIYIFALPRLDLFIIGFTEEERRKRNDKKLAIAKKHTVDGDLYYNLKLEVEKEKKKIVQADSKTKNLATKINDQNLQIADLNTRIAQANASYDRIKIHLDNLNSRKDISKTFQGRWQLVFEDTVAATHIKGEEEIEINGTQYYVVNNTVVTHKFDLILLDYDIERKWFTFVKFNLTKGGQHLINELKIIDNDWLEGKENRTTLVTYKRRNPIKSKNEVESDF